MTADAEANTLITVGFDGSEPSFAALRWAIAVRESGTIQVVTSYQPKGSESIDVARMRAEAIVNAAGKVDPGGAEVILRAIPGEATEVLLECSQNSRLLVVGRHGTSGIIHCALGSTGDACARMATCPVVIVPPDRRPD